MAGLVSGWVLKNSPVVKHGHLLVLMVLADCAHDDGTSAYPSVDTIAERARSSRRNVQYALRELEAGRHIQRQGKTSSGTTIWRVQMELARAQSGGAQQGAQPLHPAQPVAPEPSLTTLPKDDLDGEDGSDGSGATTAPLAAPPDFRRPVNTEVLDGPDAAPLDAPSDEDRAAWTAAHQQLRSDTSDFIWHTWLAPLELVGASRNLLHITAPDNIRTWIRDRHLPAITKAATAAFDRPVGVELVAPEPAEAVA